MRRIRLRILLPVAVLYFIAFLDRANVAYAKLTMAPELGFSEWVYGFGAGLFFVGYLLPEIPGALIVQRWGARRWVTLIMVSWGTCAMSLGFIHSATAFYVGRFCLGVAEGGLFPGVIVYLSHWVPARHGAGAIAIFTLASPAALAAGGPFAGWLLTLHWMGLSGWRWLSILEALPAIGFGILTWFVLPDDPRKVSWLSAGQCRWLVEQLHEEDLTHAQSGFRAMSAIFLSPLVLLLCGIIFLANIGIQGFFLWVPTTLQHAAGLTASRASMLSGIPFAVAVISVLVCSWSSDRSQRRALHIYLPLLLSGIIFSLTSLDGLRFGWLFLLLCLSSAAIYGFGPSFYLVPSLVLPGRQAAAVVGLVNMFAGLGGFTGPAIAGRMLATGYPFSAVVRFLSGCFFLGGALCFWIRKRIKNGGPTPAAQLEPSLWGEEV